jgi:small-conductance mechanosensitive channel
MDFLGIKLVGLDLVHVHKLLISIAYIVLLLGGSAIIRAIIGVVLRKADAASVKTRFWTRQAVSLLTSSLLILGLLSIWFDDPARLGTALGLMSAGLAFALQQVVTSLAGYFVILRGEAFTVGDRISMGGVRGDVLHLGFLQTTILEMGQPPRVQSADPAVWVQSRQFTGRIATVTNSQIFKEPVFNYTRDFPYIWEEMMVPITYKADRDQVEKILLEAAKEHAVDPEAIEQNKKNDLEKKFQLKALELAPRVYYRLTDNWLELTVRFVVDTHYIRNVKDDMSRFIIAAFDKAGIGIASATYDIVGFPTLDIRNVAAPKAPAKVPAANSEHGDTSAVERAR